ncbi:MAG: peptide chain release factor 2 [Jiangellales bacterium]
MAEREFSSEIDQLSATLSGIEQVLDVDALRAQAAELETQASDPDLWNDPANAQRVTSKLSSAQADIRRLEEMRAHLDDLPVLLEMAQEADGDDAAAAFVELESELDAMTRSVADLEVRTLLSGEYDSRDALVNLRAGAGGVDAADFTDMLLRMYLRWAERHGYAVDVYDTSYAEEAGIKSATFVVHAPFAYGTLSVEQGTHRLVRISPFDNQNRRQTSFAEVEVLPVVEQTDHIAIPDDEIRVDVYRSSGPGGQGVNTTDSAVRLTHVPTGIVVTCQNERSQLQNRARAMEVLQAKLLERKRADEQAKIDALKGDTGGSWGNQMRSYVLHPYQMVKDLRTEHEVGNTSGVFDGDIDGFLESAIRWRRSSARTLAS